MFSLYCYSIVYISLRILVFKISWSFLSILMINYSTGSFGMFSGSISLKDSNPWSESRWWNISICFSDGRSFTNISIFLLLNPITSPFIMELRNFSNSSFYKKLYWIMSFLIIFSYFWSKIRLNLSTDQLNWLFL